MSRPSAARESDPGESFADYLLTDRLGTGGMAEVLLAKSPSGALVALKRMLPDCARGSESRRVFRDESRLGLHLRHRCIATVLSQGEDRGIPFLTMEWVEGADLQALLGRRRAAGETLPASLVLTLAVDVASALEYAHGLDIGGRHARIVHRDVSPANVLVSNEGAVKLSDFGIARASIHEHRTQSGFVKGKLRYMSPEQALGLPIDRRCDLFSLGVVLYECLAGFRPYDGATDLESLDRAKRGSHVPLTRAAPEAPEVLVRVIERLLRPQASERFASAGEVLDALSPLGAPGEHERARLGHLAREASSIRRRNSEPSLATGTEPARPSAFPPAQERISGVAPRRHSRRANVRLALPAPLLPREYRPPAFDAPNAMQPSSPRRPPARPHVGPIVRPLSVVSPRVVGPVAAGAAIGVGIGLMAGALGLVTAFAMIGC